MQTSHSRSKRKTYIIGNTNQISTPFIKKQGKSVKFSFYINM